ILKKAGNNTSDGYELSMTGGGFFFRINQATYGNVYRLSSESYTSPVDGRWVHVAATYDGQTMSLYIDGELNSSTTFPSAVAIASNGLPLGIGAQHDGVSRFRGGLDEVRIYGIALGAADIRALAEVPPAPQSAPVPVSPTSGSVGVSLPAVLVWQPVEGALSYRVQVTAVGGSGAVVFDGDVPGTSAEVGGLSAGAVYEWRVRALNAAGQGPWSEPWGFTVAPPPVVVPAAAILIAPQNQAAEVPLISSLTWAAVDGADTYRIQLWKDGEDANKLLDEEEITDLSYAVSLPDHEAGYSWRVRAANVAGHGPWSDSWHFTTVSAPVAIPETPNLIAPQNQAAEVPLISSLTWAAVDGADTYRIQLWKDGEDANKLLDEE